jgi:hypothetical protein
VALAELDRLLREIRRRADVAGRLPEVLRERHAFGDREAAVHARTPPRATLLAGHDEHDLAQQRALASGALLFRRSKR